MSDFLNSREWLEIENMFREEIVNGRSTKNIKTEGMDDRAIARQVEAANMAAKMVEKVLNKVNKLKLNNDLNEPKRFV